MVRRLAIAALAAAVAAPVHARAEDVGPAPTSPAAPERPRFRVGIGASLASSGLAPVIYVPMEFSRLRLEWEVGFTDGLAGDASLSTSHVGLGIFGLSDVAPGARAAYGVRLQHEWLSMPGASAESTRVAAALGGEWLPHPLVSFGVEGQLGYAEPSGNVRPVNGRGLSTAALVFLRVYLSSREQVAGARAGGSPATPARPGAAPAAPAPPTPPAEPATLQRCQRSPDCSPGEICFDGYCRH